MLIGDLVEERHEDVEAGLQRAAVLAEALHDEGRLLRHDDGRLENRHDHDERDDREEDEGGCHGCLLFLGGGWSSVFDVFRLLPSNPLDGEGEVLLGDDTHLRAGHKALAGDGRPFGVAQEDAARDFRADRLDDLPVTPDVFGRNRPRLRRLAHEERLHEPPQPDDVDDAERREKRHLGGRREVECEKRQPHRRRRQAEEEDDEARRHDLQQHQERPRVEPQPFDTQKLHRTSFGWLSRRFAALSS